MSDQQPESPCTGVCRLDRDEICQGCGRNLAEIAGWSTASSGEKQRILGRAAARRQASGGRRTGNH